MIGYYAVGGGLGHLTRGRRVLETLGIEAAFVTASAYASDPRVTGGRPFVLIPSHLEGDADAHRAFLRELGFERLIVDTFPGGIQGELCGLDVPMDLVARRVRWEEYRRVVPGELPRFGTIYQVEELEPSEKADLSSVLLRALCASVVNSSSPQRHRGAQRRTEKDFWLIVHSGPEHEVRELVAYAQELSPERVLVATRCNIDLPANFERIDEYPVAHLYPHATKIISAAGFNVMLETEPWRDKHHPIPFPRRFDDQFARAARRRNCREGWPHEQAGPGGRG